MMCKGRSQQHRRQLLLASCHKAPQSLYSSSTTSCRLCDRLHVQKVPPSSMEAKCDCFCGLHRVTMCHRTFLDTSSVVSCVLRCACPQMLPTKWTCQEGGKENTPPVKRRKSETLLQKGNTFCTQSESVEHFSAPSFCLLRLIPFLGRPMQSTSITWMIVPCASYRYLQAFQGDKAKGA